MLAHAPPCGIPAPDGPTGRVETLEGVRPILQMTNRKMTDRPYLTTNIHKTPDGGREITIRVTATAKRLRLHKSGNHWYHGTEVLPATLIEALNVLTEGGE